MMLRGSCLCQGMRFEIEGTHSGIGFCHCSLCRKISGVGSTGAIVVDYHQLRWVQGDDLVTVYERPSGYGSAFCRVCGSPAPDRGQACTVYTIPVGLLDDAPPLPVADHIYVASKAPWDAIGDGAPCYANDGPPRARS